MPRRGCRWRPGTRREATRLQAPLAALKGLVLKGGIVTGDALHCHPAMAAEVRATGAHYALKLKGNNAPLFACVEAAFAAADAGGKLAFYEKSESGHDRQERRRASVIAKPADGAPLPGPPPLRPL